MSIPNINYRGTYFPKPDLSPIIGKPTFEDDLYQLIIDLRLNAQSVHSNLGGGAHGHLGLVMTPQQYAIQSQTPYVRPTHPNPLVIPAGTAHVAADELERTYKENLCVFHEVCGVEQALIQQLVSAVEDKNLLAFKNCTTGRFNGNILQIFQYLLSTYGQISPAQLTAFNEEVTKMTYHPTTPIDLVFAEIDNLLMYSEFAQTPFSTKQAISKAYNIIKNCSSIYNDYLRAWNHHNAANSTWPAFQQHFRDTYTELEATGALTVDEMEFGKANFIKQVASRASADIMQHANLITQTQPPTPAPALIQEPVPQPTANAVIDDSLIAQLLAQNKQLIESLANQNPRFTRHRQPHPTTGPCQGQPKTPLPAHFNKYCWTHGHCNHLGSTCNNKAPGRKNEATIENKMGGSCYACP